MTSCFHNDRERSEGKIGDVASIGGGVGSEATFSLVVEGNIASRCCSVAAIRSGRSESVSKLMQGYMCCCAAGEDSRSCSYGSGCSKSSSKSLKSSSAPTWAPSSKSSKSSPNPSSSTSGSDASDAGSNGLGVESDQVNSSPECRV